MTYVECRAGETKLWIGPFSKAITAKAWLRRHEAAYALTEPKLHETRAKVLFAAYAHGDVPRCVGVFESARAATAAAGAGGIVMNWIHADCVDPEDSLPLLARLQRPGRAAEPRPTQR